jgi:hypothetical protein
MDGECKFCGLLSPLQERCLKYKLHFCDDDCCSAYSRQEFKNTIEDDVKDLKSIIQEFKSKCPCEGDDDARSLCLRVLQLRYLFYRGLLQRQTKKQLTLLHSKLVESDQELFLVIDAEREIYTDEELLYFADLCSKEHQDLMK